MNPEYLKRYSRKDQLIIGLAEVYPRASLKAVAFAAKTTSAHAGRVLKETGIRPSGEKCTARQVEVFSWIAAFIASNGFPPSVREVRDGAGYKQINGAMCCLKGLRNKGCLIWVPGKSRTIRLLKAPHELL